ncbi:MAG TPA: S8 family peptidase [Calditerricola sp.]
MMRRLWWLTMVLVVALLPSVRMGQPPAHDEEARLPAPGPPADHRLQARGQPNAQHYREGEVVIRFARHPDEKTMRRWLDEVDAVHVRHNHLVCIVRSRVKSTEELIRFFSDKGVAYVEPNYVFRTNAFHGGAATGPPSQPPNTGARKRVPNDEFYRPYQWNLPLIGSERGWRISTGEPTVVVAVVDTGVDLDHPDLRGQLVPGRNIVNPAAPPQDDQGHGTHVAGIIAARTNNHRGVAGVTWQCRIMPVKVLDANGAGNLFDVGDGIIWATDNGAKVINLSLGNYVASRYLRDAVRYAFERDVVLVAASGNDALPDSGFPASYPEVLAVSALRPDRHLATYSNYGSSIDLTAPGDNIASTFPDNQYAAMSGTSMASPHVAGVAALVRSVNPTLSNREVMALLIRTSRDLGRPGWDPLYGHGQVDVAAALREAERTYERRVDAIAQRLAQVLRRLGLTDSAQSRGLTGNELAALLSHLFGDRGAEKARDLRQRRHVTLGEFDRLLEAFERDAGRGSRSNGFLASPLLPERAQSPLTLRAAVVRMVERGWRLVPQQIPDVKVEQGAHIRDGQTERR